MNNFKHSLLTLPLLDMTTLDKELRYQVFLSLMSPKSFMVKKLVKYLSPYPLMGSLKFPTNLLMFKIKENSLFLSGKQLSKMLRMKNYMLNYTHQLLLETLEVLGIREHLRVIFQRSLKDNPMLFSKNNLCQIKPFSIG